MLNKKVILTAFSLGAAGFGLWHCLEQYRKEVDTLRIRVEQLENSRIKFDMYQKLYVALMKEYAKKQQGEYHSYIADRLKQKEINSIILYGCGPVGKLFYDVMKDESVDIRAFIDNAPREKDYQGIPVYELEHTEDLKKADCILVTPVYLYGNILNDLYASGRDEKILPVTSFVQMV